MHIKWLSDDLARCFVYQCYHGNQHCPCWYAYLGNPRLGNPQSYKQQTPRQAIIGPEISDVNGGIHNGQTGVQAGIFAMHACPKLLILRLKFRRQQSVRMQRRSLLANKLYIRFSYELAENCYVYAPLNSTGFLSTTVPATAARSGNTHAPQKNSCILRIKNDQKKHVLFN